MERSKKQRKIAEDETPAVPRGVIAEIAKKYLRLKTIDTRNSDDLDFSDQAVWSLRTALEAAYNAGLAAGSAK